MKVPAASKRGFALRIPIGSNSTRRRNASIPPRPPPAATPTIDATTLLVPLE